MSAATEVSTTSESKGIELKSSPTKQKQQDEPLLTENKQRFVLFPIKYDKIWEMYKKHEASFWTAEEIDLSQDTKDWNTLASEEQHFIKTVLAFFAARYAPVSPSLSLSPNPSLFLLYPPCSAAW